MALLSPQQYANLRATIQQRHRAERGMIAADELLKRAKGAARVVLQGATFSADDRDECASVILADGLELAARMANRRRRAAGANDPTWRAWQASYVRADDPRQSFTAYRHRAEHFKRDLLKRMTREQAAGDAEADKRASAPMVGVQLERGDVDPVEQAREQVAETMSRLGLENENARTFLYWQVRDVDQQVIADEEGSTVGAIKMRCKRGALAVKRAYPTYRELLDALIAPGCQWCLEDGEVLIRFARAGSLPAGARLPDDVKPHRGMMTPEWRTGTDAGEQAQRPTGATREQRAAEAKEACRKGKPSAWGIGSYRRTAKHLSDQERAEALGRLSKALYLNDPHRKPRKKKPRKVTARDERGSADPIALTALAILAAMAGAVGHMLGLGLGLGLI